MAAAITKGAPVMIAGRGGALALVGFLSLLIAGCGENPAPTPAIVAASVSPDQLVGKWGFAAYHKDEDRARTIKEASAQCNRPYVIAKGPTGGVMMKMADQKELSELFLVGGPTGQTYLRPQGAAAGGPDDRIVTKVDSNSVTQAWDVPENARPSCTSL